MARPKKEEVLKEQVTFRCTAEVKRGVKILGMLDGYKTTSAMIFEILSDFVKENERRIKAFEQSVTERPIKKPQYESVAVADDKQKIDVVSLPTDMNTETTRDDSNAKD